MDARRRAREGGGGGGGEGLGRRASSMETRAGRRASSMETSDGDDGATVDGKRRRRRRRTAVTRAMAVMMAVMMTTRAFVVSASTTTTMTTTTPTVNSRDPARFGVVPSGRSGAASATFVGNGSATPRLVVFGGHGGDGDVNDVWEYDAGMTVGTGAREGAWTRLHDGEATTGTAPSARSGASACALRGNLYVFGGHSRMNGDLDDLWTFDRAGETWREISPAGGVKPPKRSGATLSAPEGESGAECILFAGNGFNDVWSFNIDTNAWTLVRDNTATSGSVASRTLSSLCAAAAVATTLLSLQ